MATSPNTTNTNTGSGLKSNVIKLEALKGVKFGVGVALGLLVALAIGASAMYYLASKYLAKAPPGAAAPVAAEISQPTNPVFVSLEPFTVNLRMGGQGRFLHVGITLKVGDPKAQALVVQYMPEVRSRVLMLLSDRASETLISPNDKAKLAEEIQTALNKPFAPNLPSLQISSVVFTAFVLQ